MSSPYPAPQPVDYQSHLNAGTPGVVSPSASPLVGGSSYSSAVDIKMPADASKNEKQARLIWKIVDTVVALLLIITVILLWVYYPSWQTVVTGLFVMALGILLAVCNFKVMPIAKKFALFLFTPLGRGLSYFFIGSFVVVANWWWVILVGIIVMGVGIVYIITAFVKIPYLETTHLDDEAA